MPRAAPSQRSVRRSVRPHQFELDAGVPADHRGRTWCRCCRLPGRPGDDRHPVDAPGRYPQTPPEVLSAELRRLGEDDD